MTDAAPELTPGVTVSRCEQCRAPYFPWRLMCPRCGSDRLAPDKVHQAVIEQATCVRHAAGQENWTPRHLATARTPENQLLVIGLEEALPAGARVALFERGTAPYGRRELGAG